jgi:hypothetical protein
MDFMMVLSNVLGLAVIALTLGALRMRARITYWRDTARTAVRARQEAEGERDFSQRELARLRGRLYARARRRDTTIPLTVSIDTTPAGMRAACDELRARVRSAQTGSGAA